MEMPTYARCSSWRIAIEGRSLWVAGMRAASAQQGSSRRPSSFGGGPLGTRRLSSGLTPGHSSSVSTNRTSPGSRISASRHSSCRVQSASTCSRIDWAGNCPAGETTNSEAANTQAMREIVRNPCVTVS